MARHCDYCGESEKSSPVRETFAVLSQIVPGSGGRQGKATTEKINRFPIGESCLNCAKRISLLIGNMIASVKVGETALPEMLEPEEPGQPARTEAEGPGQQQPELPLGGTDDDSRPLPTREELGSGPEPFVETDGSMPFAKEPVPETGKAGKRRQHAG